MSIEYWRGYMNWTLDIDWKCEICGENKGLEWGMVHAQCRCNVCHTEYRMRDEEDKIVSKPIVQWKAEYCEAIKAVWQKLHKPFDEIPSEGLQKLIEEFQKTKKESHQ